MNTFVGGVSLPSSDAAGDLILGKPGSLAAVTATTLARAALIGIGLYVVGEREPQRLFRNALGGSLAIEAFVLGWVYLNRGDLK